MISVDVGTGTTKFDSSPTMPASPGSEDRIPSPWEIAPTVMRHSMRGSSPSDNKLAFAGLHRAAGFTRRFQRAAGLLADESHERWDAHRLPGTLRIASILRPAEIFPFAQPPAAGPAQAIQTREQQFQSLWASRQQKRTAGAIAMAAGKEQPRQSEHRRAHLDLPPLQPARMRLRTSERAARHAQQMRELFDEGVNAAEGARSADTAEGASSVNTAEGGVFGLPKSACNVRVSGAVRSASPSAGAGNFLRVSQVAVGHEAGDHADAEFSSAANARERAEGQSRRTRRFGASFGTAPRFWNTDSKSKQEQHALWRWPSLNIYSCDQALTPPPGGSIPPNAALFQGHACGTSDRKLDSRFGGRPPGSSPRKSPASPCQYSIPHVRDQRVMRIMTGSSQTTLAADRTRPTTFSTFHDDPSYDGDQSLCNDSLMLPSPMGLDAGAKPQIRRHTFSSRRKKRGAGPVLKTAQERADLLSRSSSDLQINLEEEPDPWSIKQANRAARKEAEEWQRCLHYKEPKPHGGKCVNFQSALRNAIGPRMEIKQLTYDEIRTKDLMEASQLFLPPSAKKSAINMHYHMQTHGIRSKEPRNSIRWPMKRFHHQYISTHARKSSAGKSPTMEDDTESPDSDSVKWLVLDHSTLASTMTCARTKSGVVGKNLEQAARSQAELAFKLLDIDNNRRLTHEEFTRFTGLDRLEAKSFAHIDKDGNGAIDEDELFLFVKQQQLAASQMMTMVDEEKQDKHYKNLTSPGKGSMQDDRFRAAMAEREAFLQEIGDTFEKSPVFSAGEVKLVVGQEKSADEMSLFAEILPDEDREVVYGDICLLEAEPVAAVPGTMVAEKGISVFQGAVVSAVGPDAEDPES